MPRRLSALLVAIGALVLAACSSNGDAALTPSPALEQTTATTGTPGPEATTRAPFILPTATPDPDLVELAATVWLVDIASETVTTIVEDREDWPYAADFTEDGDVLVRYWLESGKLDRSYAPDGTLIEEAEPRDRCTTGELGAEIDGRLYLGVVCGTFSPGGTLMTYPVVTDEATLSWDQWLLNLGTGVHWRLQADLLNCGGCDFKFGPSWSASGRYLVVPDLVRQVFLFDVVSGTGIDIALDDRATQLSLAPRWSPAGDRLLRPGPDGSTILQDFDAGTTTQFDDLPWPSAFDPTGGYIYSPAWWSGASNDSGPVPPAATTIADSATGEVVETRPGAPAPERLWDETGDPIIGSEDGFVAILGHAEGCTGALAYEPKAGVGTCIEGAMAPVFSPDLTTIAFVRETGRTGPTTGPRLDSHDGVPTWEVALFDRASGNVTVLTDGPRGHNFPDLVWNAEGTHLLIRWPNPFGL